MNYNKLKIKLKKKIKLLKNKLFKFHNYNKIYVKIIINNNQLVQIILIVNINFLQIKEKYLLKV